MLAVEPRGDDGRDEELAAYGSKLCQSREPWRRRRRGGRGSPLVFGPALAIESWPGLV